MPPEPPSSVVPAPDSEWEQGRAWEDDPSAVREDRGQAHLDEVDKVRAGAKIRAIFHSGILVVGLMYFGATAFVITVSLWFWHFLAPEKYWWISEQHLHQIQTILFSGSLAAIISLLSQRYIGIDPRDAREH